MTCYFWPFLYVYLYSLIWVSFSLPIVKLMESAVAGLWWQHVSDYKTFTQEAFLKLSCTLSLYSGHFLKVTFLGSFKCFHFLPLFFSPSCYCGRSCVPYPSSWSVFSLCSLCFSVFLNLSKLPICQVFSCHHCTELCVCFKLLIKVLKEFFTLCKYNLILWQF